MSGAGLYEKKHYSYNFPEFKARPVANNSLTVSGIAGLKLLCLSNSSQSGVGNITILNGTTLSHGHTDIWRIGRPHNRPGFVRIANHYRSIITSEHQGIYSCTILDSNGNEFVFNFGLYPNGFTGNYKHTQYPPLTSMHLSQSPPPSLT